MRCSLVRPRQRDGRVAGELGGYPELTWRRFPAARRQEVRLGRRGPPCVTAGASAARTRCTWRPRDRSDGRLRTANRLGVPCSVAFIRASRTTRATMGWAGWRPWSRAICAGCTTGRGAPWWPVRSCDVGCSASASATCTCSGAAWTASCSIRRGARPGSGRPGARGATTWWRSTSDGSRRRRTSRWRWRRTAQCSGCRARRDA